MQSVKVTKRDIASAGVGALALFLLMFIIPGAPFRYVYYKCQQYQCRSDRFGGRIEISSPTGWTNGDFLMEILD